MTKIDTRGRKVNVEDGKQGFQETQKTEPSSGASLTDHFGLQTPAQPTRLPKSFLRKMLPTRADDQPILVFEREGQQFWTNRFVMLDVETIAPYVGGLEAKPGAPVEARVSGGSLTDVGEEFWIGNDAACIGLMERTEDRISATWPDRFDVTNPDHVTYVDDDPIDENPYYLLSVDPEGRTSKTAPRVIKVRADHLHLALGTDDLTTVDPGVDIEQAPRGNSISGPRGYTPLVISRDNRRVGMIMPMRHFEQQ